MTTLMMSLFRSGGPPEGELQLIPLLLSPVVLPFELVLLLLLIGCHVSVFFFFMRVIV